MEKLYAVRHGESLANVLFAAEGAAADGKPVLDGGDAQVPLTDAGRAQAAGLRGWLAGAGVDLVAVSPYLRARQTWEAMAGDCGARVVVDERLRDREAGVFDLFTPAGVALRAPDEAARRAWLGEWYYRPPGGESLADVALRVRDFTRDVTLAAAGRRVLVVAHDATVLTLRHVLAGFGAPVPDASVTASAAVPNASVSTWEADGGNDGMRLVSFGVREAPPGARG